MTDQEINLAIAEACPCLIDMEADCAFPVWRDKSAYDERGLSCFVEFNPCDDLNAMHEAEDFGFYNFGLTWHRKFVRELHQIVTRDGQSQQDPKEAGWYTWWLGSHATARQRAEAFLKTIGKWKAVKNENK